MSIESNGHGAKKHASEIREATGVDKDGLRPEQANDSYYAEASLIKKVVVFGLSTAAVLIALGLIYVFWPL